MYDIPNDCRAIKGNNMNWPEQYYVAILLLNLAVVMGFVLILWLISIPLKDVSIIDMAFAVILLAVAYCGYQLGPGVSARKQLILALVSIWAVRITWHLVRRNWGHGEDARYSKLRSWVENDRAFVWLSLRKVFLLQGVVLWLVSLPIQAAAIYRTPLELGWIAYVGALICVSGIVIETIADTQLTRFRANPSKAGRTQHWTLAIFTTPELFRRTVRLVGSVCRYVREPMGPCYCHWTARLYPLDR